MREIYIDFQSHTMIAFYKILKRGFLMIIEENKMCTKRQHKRFIYKSREDNN